MATDFTDGMALMATRLVFEYLPRAYEKGAQDPFAREKMGNASTLAGMAFANAFLGVCHSMAHKLGAYHHLPARPPSCRPSKAGPFSREDDPCPLHVWGDGFWRAAGRCSIGC